MMNRQKHLWKNNNMKNKSGNIRNGGVLLNQLLKEELLLFQLNNLILSGLNIEKL